MRRYLKMVLKPAQRTVACACAFGLAILPLSNYRPAPRGQAAQPRGPSAAHQMPMGVPTVAPLFLEGGGFTSTVVLVNPASTAANVALLVRRADGTQAGSKALSVQPRSQLRVALADVPMSAGPPPEEGSVFIVPGNMEGGVVAAQLEIGFALGASPSYIDEEFAMPTGRSSTTLRGVAPASSQAPVIAVTSLSANAQNVTISCASEAATATRQVALEPGATALSLACDSQPVAGDPGSLGDLAPQDNAGRPTTLGIAVQSDAPPGSFAAFAIDRDARDGVLLFAAVALVDPRGLRSANTAFPGVPVGFSDSFPGDYTPQLSVANFGNSVAKVAVTYARTPAGSGAEPDTQLVRQFAVGPGRARTVSMPELEGSPAMADSLVVSSSANPGDVVTSLLATSDQPPLDLLVQGRHEQALDNGGRNPWALDQGTGSDATLLLFNHASATEEFTVSIGSGRPLWLKRWKLRPMQTLAISMRELISKGVRDDSGHPLPRSLTSGEIDWHTTAPGAGKGRVFESNPASLTARSFACIGKYDLCSFGASVSGQPVTIAVGDTVGLVAQGLQCVSSDPYSDNCYCETGVPYNATTSWSGCLHTSGCDGSSGAISLTGQSVGQDSLLATLTDYPNSTCSDSAGATADVVQFQVQGNQYSSVFVGTDPGLAVANTFTTSISPTGGSFTARSSDSHDTFAYGSIGNSPSAVITTPDQSSTSLDRLLSFMYAINGDIPDTKYVNVTARQFAYATNSGLSNACSGNGFDYTITYTPYTHPDRSAVQPGIGVDGAVVAESFSPGPLSCPGSFTMTGSGALDQNSEFSDRILFCSSQPLPTCTTSSTQTIGVAGYTVRTNTLSISNGALTYTNQGPSQ